jgi:hypothetical protein
MVLPVVQQNKKVSNDIVNEIGIVRICRGFTDLLLLCYAMICYAMESFFSDKHKTYGNTESKMGGVSSKMWNGKVIMGIRHDHEITCRGGNETISCPRCELSSSIVIGI